MKIALFGYGKMGRIVEKLAQLEGHTIVEPQLAEVGIDFSHKDVVLNHIEWSCQSKKPLIIGTTDWDSQLEFAKNRILQESSAALFSSNFSLGMALFKKLLLQGQRYFSDYEIVGLETHHNQKKDAPSGTAKEIAHLLDMKTPFASLRYGKEVGKHEVIFNSLTDSITLTHQAHSREGFAKGALIAAQWIHDKKGWFTLDDMLRSLYSSDYSL